MDLKNKELLGTGTGYALSMESTQVFLSMISFNLSGLLRNLGKELSDCGH